MIATYYNKDLGQEYQFNNNEILLTFYDIYGIDEPKSVPIKVENKYLDQFIEILKSEGFKKV